MTYNLKLKTEEQFFCQNNPHGSSYSVLFTFAGPVFDNFYNKACRKFC